MTDLTQTEVVLERTRDALIEDLKSVISDADGLMKNVVSGTSEEFQIARKHIEARIDQARSQLADARVVVSRKACGAADATNEYISENRLKVIGVASLLGVIGACLLIRHSMK